MHNVLLVTKGHPYEREPFYDVFDAMAHVNWTLVEQPAAQALFSVDQAAGYDAFVLYDMPGIEFMADGAPKFVPPREAFKRSFLELLEAGKGLCFYIMQLRVGRLGLSMQKLLAGVFSICQRICVASPAKIQVIATT